jgi:hypothetical protein
LPNAHRIGKLASKQSVFKISMYIMDFIKAQPTARTIATLKPIVGPTDNLAMAWILVTPVLKADLGDRKTGNFGKKGTII